MPGSGQLWQSNQCPTVPIAPKITGITTPVGECSQIHWRSSSNHSRDSSKSGKQIRSLLRPLSPPSGSHSFARKRHSNYPQTSKVQRLLSGDASFQSTRYQTLNNDLTSAIDRHSIAVDLVSGYNIENSRIMDDEVLTPQAALHHSITPLIKSS